MKYTKCLGYECPLVWKSTYCPICNRHQLLTHSSDKVRCKIHFVICVNCQNRCPFIDKSEPENNDAIVGKVVFVDHV